jgi:insertion element IS1 protein InsB
MCERACTHCGSPSYVKNGMNQGHQRYLCRRCKRNFTDDTFPACPEGKPAAMKFQAVLMYGKSNASFRMIGKLFGVSATAVMKWVRTFASHLPEPSVPAKGKDVVILLDEMHHFIGKKADKLWVWRAYDPLQKRTIGWVLGKRNDAALQELLAKIGTTGRVFFTDDWEGYHRVIPEAQLYTGKDLTFPIEGDNSNVRHYLARFRRRTKVVSRSKQMIDLSLRLLYHLQNPPFYQSLAEKVRFAMNRVLKDDDRQAWRLSMC